MEIIYKYEPVENKPDYYWLNKMNKMIISKEVLEKAIKNGNKNIIIKEIKKLKEITFKYRDYLCNDHKWRTQHCTVSSVDECIRIYGLDDSDVEYEILEVKEVE